MAALREQDGGSVMTCPREESFEAMFAALGNSEEQDRIRRESMDKAHCSILRESSFACTELPRAFGDVPAGSVCPNNPYVRQQAVILKRELYQRLLQFTIDAHRHLRIGGLTENCPRVEVTLAYAYQRWLEERQWLKL